MKWNWMEFLNDFGVKNLAREFLETRSQLMWK